ncbi:MAG: TolC family outer membrane protein [Paracoccaceae bacterium]|jgi:outer membrane protein|nr:TolC family outer membrane protein [Paracoccaceae bacterium]
MLGLKLRNLVAIGLAFSLSTAAQAETFKSALAKAYNHSGLLEQNQALLRAADEDVFRAMSALLPVLNWTASVSQSYSANALGTSDSMSGSVGLSAQMALYDFGRGQLGIDLANEAVMGTRQRLGSIEQSVLLRAIEAYMQYRQATELVALGENNLNVIQEELRAANDRFDVGEITRTDVALAEAALARSNSSLAQSRGDLVRARENFVASVGVAPKSLAGPGAMPSLPDSAAIAKAIAGRGHPDVLAAQSAVTQAEIQVSQNEAEVMPNISLTGRVSLSDTFSSTSFSNSTSIGIEASMPIYSGGRLDASIRQAKAREDSAKASLRTTMLDIEMQVGSAYARLTVANANRRATEQQIAAAQIAFDGVREEATLGARTTLDVLNAEQDLLDAKANLVVANTEVIVATYSVMAALGQLTAKNLDLSVETYDPAAYAASVRENAPSARGAALDKVLSKLGK